MIPRHLIIGMSAMLIVVLLVGIYVWRMRTRVVELHPSAADTRAVAPPVTGRTEQVTLFVAYDDSGTLRPQSARIPLPAGRQQRAEELLRALVDIYLGESAAHRLPRGAEVRNVYLVDPGLAVIDTDSAFADGHRSGISINHGQTDRKSTRLNSSHVAIPYAVFCLKKKSHKRDTT